MWIFVATAVRTVIVLVFSWFMVFVTGKQREVTRIGRKELVFICLSGVATGASWLCYYHALQEGPASIVAPVDKLSVLVTVAFSYFVFGEKLGEKGVGRDGSSHCGHSGTGAFIDGRLLLCTDQVADIGTLLWTFSDTVRKRDRRLCPDIRKKKDRSG